MIWSQYAETRSGEVPKQFLFAEPPEAADNDPPSDGLYLLTVGYSGYTALALQEGIIGYTARWANGRRKFVEAAEGRSKPILDKIKARLDEKGPKVLPKGRQAVRGELGSAPEGSVGTAEEPQLPPAIVRKLWG